MELTLLEGSVIDLQIMKAQKKEKSADSLVLNSVTLGRIV